MMEVHNVVTRGFTESIFYSHLCQEDGEVRVRQLLTAMVPEPRPNMLVVPRIASYSFCTHQVLNNLTPSQRGPAKKHYVNIGWRQHVLPDQLSTECLILKINLTIYFVYS